MCAVSHYRSRKDLGTSIIGYGGVKVADRIATIWSYCMRIATD